MKDQDELREAVKRKARVLHIGHSVVGTLCEYFEAGTFLDEEGNAVPQPVIAAEGGNGKHRFLAVPELIVELTGDVAIVFETLESDVSASIKRIIGLGASLKLHPMTVAEIVVCVLRAQVVALCGLASDEVTGWGSDERDQTQG